MKHPLGIAALSYLAGLLAAGVYQPPLPWLFGVSLFVAAAAIIVSRLRSFLIWPLLLLTGWTNLALHRAVVSPNDLRTILDGSYEEVLVRGFLRETPEVHISERDDEETLRTLAQLKVTELRRGEEWQPATGRIVVFTPGVLGVNYYAGQRVEVSGIVSFPQRPIAEGLFDYRTYLSSQGIYFQLRNSSVNEWKLGEPHLTRRPIADRFLAWAQSTLARGLPQEDEPLRLLWAMTLGWRSGVTNGIYEPFMQSGTMHIFAISGLHIALIAGILVAVLRVVRVPRFACGAVVIPLIWFYTAATGWQPSAIRATIMMSIVVGGWALKRPGNLLNSLAAAALIILLWKPEQLSQAGFQLSFLVVLSIALIQPPLDRLRDRLMKTDPMRPVELLPRWQRWMRFLLRWSLIVVGTSLAAWLGSWPLTAHYFHLFSPVTLLANILIVPLSSLALASTLGSLACGGWFVWASELFNHSAWFWMWLMVEISRGAADLPGAFMYATSPTLVDFAIYYSLLFGVLSGKLLCPPNRKWLAATLVAVGLFYSWRWVNAQRSITITAVPLNGGSSVFFDGPGRKDDLLVDCGNSNSVQSVLMPLLHAEGVNRVQRLLLTHGDLRNVGGTELLLETAPAKKVVVSNVRFRSPAYRRILSDLHDQGEKLQIVNRGDSVSGWSVLHPESDDSFPQADDGAVVLLGEFYGTRVLLLSDLGKPGQNVLMERDGDLRADIVVSGLPEKSEPLSNALLDLIRPKVIIVMDSEFPATKRADAALRRRLELQHVPVIYTRNSGAVRITVSKDGWQIHTVEGQLMWSDKSTVIHRS